MVGKKRQADEIRIRIPGKSTLSGKNPESAGPGFPAKNQTSAAISAGSDALIQQMGRGEGAVRENQTCILITSS